MKFFIIIAVLFMLAWIPLWLAATDQLRGQIGPAFAANFLIPVAVAAVLPSGPLFFVVLFVLTVATMTRATDPLCRFVLLAALLPNPTYYVTAGSYVLCELSTHMVLAGAILAVSLFRRGDGARVPRGFTPEDGLVAIVALLLWLGADHSPTLTAFARGGLNAGLLVLIYLALRANLRDADSFKRMLGCLAVSGVILTSLAAYETVGHWEVLRLVGENIAGVPFPRGVYVRGGLLRPSASMSGPLMLTCYLSLCVLAALVSQRMFRSPLLHWVCVATILLGVVIGQSRGNIAVLGVGVLLLLALQRKWAQSAGLIGLGALAVVALTAVSWQGGERLFDAGEGYVYNGKLYSDYREVLFYRGVEEGMTHPLFGIGREEVLASLSDLVQGEGIVDFVNSYLYFFMTTGFVGFIPFVGLLALEVLRAFKKKARLDTSGMEIRAFLIAGLVSVYIELSFMSYIDRMPFMLFLLLAGVRLFVLKDGFSGASSPAAEGVGGAPQKLVESDEDLGEGVEPAFAR